MFAAYPRIWPLTARLVSHPFATRCEKRTRSRRRPAGYRAGSLGPAHFIRRASRQVSNMYPV